MRALRFHSLRTRILVLATLPLLLLAGGLTWLAHRAATTTVEQSVSRSLHDASAVLEELVRSRRDALRAQARVTASDPRFFATFSVPPAERTSDFATTLELIGEDFLGITDACFLEIYDAQGRPLARAHREGTPEVDWTNRDAGTRSLAEARQGALSTDAFTSDGQPLLVADVPVRLGARQEAVLRMGKWLGDDFAAELRRLTSAEVALLDDGRAAVSTWPADVSGLAPARDVRTAQLDSHGYLLLDHHLEGLGPGITARLGRPLDEVLAPLHASERLMAMLALLAVLVTVAGGLGIALGLTRPLHGLVAAARRLSAGDYDEPVPATGQDEVAELARSFEDMRRNLRDHVQHLRDVDRMKSDFLSLAGHELRTPLTVITSFNDMIHDGMLGDLPDEVAETTGIIKSQLGDLNELVADILDLSALEDSPELVLLKEPADLGQLLAGAERSQAALREERHVTVEWAGDPPPAPVHGDPRLLQRALRALLDNAVRFTPDGGRVQLSVETDGSRVRATIADSGVGIHPDDMRWIFEKFTESGAIEHHSSGKLEFESRGLGMGLALTRAVAAAHGGDVDVDSVVGRGSRFTLELPLSPAMDPAPTPTATLSVA